MTDRITSAEHFTLLSIVLDSERFNKSLIMYTPSSPSPVAEYNIYEDITLPYLSGNIVFQDDNDVFRLANLSGTEKLTISYQLATGESEAITKTFYITNIESPVKTNDFTTLIKMNFIEDVGWYNNLIATSKSYDGKGEGIIDTLVSQDLGANFTQRCVESQQAGFRYINPYLTPLDAAKNIITKMTTPNGLPYFLYSSIGADSIILKDMETILTSRPFNEGNPLTFSQATTNEPTGSVMRQLATIFNYEGGDLEDTLMLLQQGAVGSNYTNLNVTTGRSDNQHVDATSIIRSLIEQNIIGVDDGNPLVDLNFLADPSGNDPRKLNEFDSRHYFQVSSDNFPYDPGLNSYSSEAQFSDYSLRVIRNAMLAYLTKNIYTIYVPGMLFSTKTESTSVGNQVQIRVLKNDPDISSGAVDTRRSGNYIILAKRHLFNVMAGTHNVVLQIGRITNSQVVR